MLLAKSAKCQRSGDRSPVVGVSPPKSTQKPDEPQYVGVAIREEPLSVFNIAGEDTTFLLLMLFPGEPYVPFSSGWGISCRVRKVDCPELAGARRGLEVYVSGVIQDATENSIMLDNVRIAFGNK